MKRQLMLLLPMLFLAGCATRTTSYGTAKEPWWKPQPDNVVTVVNRGQLPIEIIEEGVVRAKLGTGEVFVEKVWTYLDADEMTLVARQADGKTSTAVFQLQRYGRKAHAWNVSLTN